MRTVIVDALVVGLPLSTFSIIAESLRSRLEGDHLVPAFDKESATAGKTVKVTVRKVFVVAQPLAALLAAIEQNESLQDRRVLTLDYGFHTLDVLASSGLTPFPERLGVVHGGVASYIDELQRAVAKTIRAEHPKIRGEFRVSSTMYEDALRAPHPHVVKLAPGDFKLADHSNGARARLAQDLQKAVALIQTINDLTAVVLAGGGAALLHDAVREQFHSVANIITLDDPQFAIARGYLLWGERMTGASRSEVAHAT